MLWSLIVKEPTKGFSTQTLGVSREKQAPPPNLHPPLTFAFLHFFI